MVRLYEYTLEENRKNIEDIIYRNYHKYLIKGNQSDSNDLGFQFSNPFHLSLFKVKLGEVIRLYRRKYPKFCVKDWMIKDSRKKIRKLLFIEQEKMIYSPSFLMWTILISLKNVRGLGRNGTTAI